MHNAGFSSDSRMQSALLENFQHRSVFRQDLGDECLEPGIPGDRGKMTHQHGADPLSLVFVDEGESYLSSCRLHYNVAAGTYDVWSSAFLSDDDQGDMADKVDV
jgi:hypothetical protein